MNSILVPLILAALAAGCARSTSRNTRPLGIDVAALEWLVRPAADDDADGRAQSRPTTAPVAPAAPSTAPVGAAPVSDPRPKDGQFSAYKPTYIIWGTTAPNVKFQFSAKFRAFAPDGPAAQQFPPISNLYFGYTQMSLWDTEDLSDTSIDTTYMPEVFYATHTAPHAHRQVGAETLGFQAGIRHESNGETDPDSRNVNYAYVQPTLYFGDPTASVAK